MPLSRAKAARALRWANLDLDDLEDPRARRGQRHSHRGLLTLLVGGLASAQRTPRDLEAFCEALHPRARRALGLKRAVSDTALYDLLKRQSSTGFALALLRMVKKALLGKTVRNDLFPMGVLSLDGKNLWSGDHQADPRCQRHETADGTPYWTLFAQRACLVSSSAQPCVHQALIPGKTNEMGHFPKFFAWLLQHFGRSFEVVTYDAGACSRENAELIHQAQKAYVFAVKENQPTLWQTARMRLGCREAEGDAECAGEVETFERASGEFVKRELWHCKAEADEPEVSFPGARELWRVRQTRTARDAAGRESTRSVEDRYFVTNQVFGPERSLKLVRLHWRVENGPNWTMDVVFREDDGSPCTKGNGLEVVSWLKLMAYNLLAMVRTKLPNAHGEKPSWKKASEQLKRALEQAEKTVLEPSSASV